MLRCWLDLLGDGLSDYVIHVRGREGVLQDGEQCRLREWLVIPDKPRLFREGAKIRR